ncbi:hypothetical protein HD554DRAFT_233140 [Boletus coccyginus]|nr:hypothetical protein HD554DRAFT_233140 [Boletus coccyginus]
MLYPSLNKSICACPGILVVIRAIPSLPCWDLRSTLANYTASSCIAHAHASFLAFFKPHSPCLASQSKAKFHSKGYVTIVLLEKKSTGSASASRCSASRTAWKPVMILTGSLLPAACANLHCLARDNANGVHTGTAWFGSNNKPAPTAYLGSRSFYCASPLVVTTIVVRIV